jgi:hypothetical protein
MPLKGFSLPLSPEGRASLTPSPPWHYAGEILLIDFEAHAGAVRAVLPPHLEPDPVDPGGCVALFVAWQYASEDGEEYLDPARSQYNEFLLLVNARYRFRAPSAAIVGADTEMTGEPTAVFCAAAAIAAPTSCRLPSQLSALGDPHCHPRCHAASLRESRHPAPRSRHRYLR